MRSVHKTLLFAAFAAIALGTVMGVGIVRAAPVVAVSGVASSLG